MDVPRLITLTAVRTKWPPGELCHGEGPGVAVIGKCAVDPTCIKVILPQEYGYTILHLGDEFCILVSETFEEIRRMIAELAELQTP